MKKTSLLFVSVLLTCLFGLNVMAQNTLPKSDFTRVKNLTPREVAQLRQQFLKKYPVFQTGSFRDYPLLLPTARIGEPTALQTPYRAGAQKMVYGSIMSANNWSSYDIPEYRMWSFPLVASDVVTFTKVADAEINANGGGVCVDGTYHFITTSTSYYSDEIYTYYSSYNAKTWAQLTFSQVDNGLTATDLAYDPTTDLVYGCFYTDDLSGFELAAINFDEGFKRSIIQLGTGHFIGMACSNDGQLYGISWNNQLYKIDKRTGAMQVVGSTGVNFSAARQSAFFDEDTNQMYFSGIIDNNNAGLYTIDLTTGAAELFVSYPHAEQLVGAFIPKAAAADDAPYKVTNLKANFAGNSTTGTVSFNLPDETVIGDDLEGDVSYQLFANGQLKAEGTGKAGKKVTIQDVTVENGQVKFLVVCSNDAGRGQETKLVTWIGYDEPLNPDNLSLSITDDGTATISWAHPTKGIHDKAVAAEDLTYTIVRYPDNEVVAQNVSGTTYTDHIDPSMLKLYYYMVTPYNSTIEGVSAYTNRLSFGDHLTIPYAESFDTADALQFFTVLNANSDAATWTVNTEGQAEYNSLFAQGAADDWLISPPLQLFADRSYRLSFSASGHAAFGYGSRDEKLTVCYGMGKTPESLSNIILDEATISGTDMTSYTFVVRPSADGDYSFAFHVTTPKASQGSELTIDDLSVELNAMNDAPAEVTNLSVVAAPKGEKKATVSFTAPTKNSADGSLTAISKIDVYRNNEVLVHTFNNPAVGASLSFEDIPEENGVVSYTVVAANEAGLGVSATASAFIGVDKPLPPQNVRLVETADDEVLVTWTAPTEGENGGYVNPDELSYRVQRSDGAWMTISQKGATSFTSDESSVHLSWQQERLYYHVHCSNEMGESGRGTSNSIIIGTPYQLPYTESFSTGFTDKQGWTNNGVGSFSQYYTTTSSDNDGHCAMFTPSEEATTADYVSSKIAILGAVQPGVRLSYYAYPGTDTHLKVALQKNADDETTLLQDIDFNTLTGEEGWRDTTIMIEGADDARYIRLHFQAQCADVNTPVAFDDVQVRDMVPYNLETTMAVPRYVRAAEDNHFYVRVYNRGTRDARNFRVQLFANNQQVAEVPSGTLRVGCDSTYQLTWKPAIEDAGIAQIHAVADYNLDADKDDNVTPDVPVTIEHSAYPTVTLTASRSVSSGSADAVSVLSWEVPVIQKETVTDDFEQYSISDFEHFGNWATFDGDEGGTYRVREFGDFPGAGMPMSWILFNTDNANALVTAHSGKQFLFTVSANYMDATDNANWLMSPQLSGDEQQVSFFYRVLDTQSPEQMRILYSLNSNHHEDFIPLDTVADMTNGEWLEYSVTLPQGTKFFAVEYISPTLNPVPFAMMIDDVTYQGIGAKLEVVGYNIYRDGQKVASVAKDVTSWTDTQMDNQPHTYAVTVVYNIGESTYSNEVYVNPTPTAIGSVNGGSADANISVLPGQIIVTQSPAHATRQVVITTIDGQLVLKTVGDVVANLRRGTYILRIGNGSVSSGSADAHKVIVP